MRDGARQARPTSYQAAIKWEQQAFEVLHDRDQVGLNLYFAAAAILGASEAMILLRFGEQSLALPHSLGRPVEECRLLHLSLHLLKEILIEVAQYETLERSTARSRWTSRCLRAVTAVFG